MSWLSNLKRIRRFLRDPEGNIWEDSQLKNLFNDAQRTVQIKTRYLEDVDAVRVPPMFDNSYLHDWEWPFLTSSTGNYQALRFHQQGDITFSYRWEPQAAWIVESTAPDEGAHFTHPWEAFMGETPGESIPLQFPRGFYEAKLVAWDREPIEYITPKAMQQDDPSWVGRMGEPFAYWRSDKTEDQFYLYPAPSTTEWDEIASGAGGESVYLVDENGNKIIYMTGGYILISEGGSSFDQELLDKGFGQVLYRDTDTLATETGLIADAEGLIQNSDYGMVTDIIDADDNVLFIYSKIPVAVADLTDESDFPSFLQKYSEYGAIERAYMADTDGQIQSLQQYWAWRQELGIKAIQRFMMLRKADRDYRLTIKGGGGFRTKRDPRLPDSYPAVRR